MNAPTFKPPTFKRSSPSPFAKKQADGPKKAACHVELAPALWADGRPAKPSAPVKVGLRLLPEAEFERCRTIAANHAWREHQNPDDEANRDDCFNSRLMGLLMAEATCHPENIDKKFFEHADTKIFLDLTPDGIRYLWDHYEAFAVVESPIAPEATDDELLELADVIRAGMLFEGLDLERARRVRRLLKAAIEATQL
jgi:hypothetical protein